MEIVARKIGNSVGAIFPKNISPEAGETFTILKIGDAYVLKPKKENIFQNATDWEGFRDAIIQEDLEWDTMNIEGEEK
jgi:hypothetical protein